MLQLTHAATISYAFESSSYNAGVSGAGVTASAVSIQLAKGTINEFSYIQVSADGSVPSDSILQTDKYFFGVSTINDIDNGPVDSSDTGFFFKLTPDAGAALDFSSAVYSMDWGGTKGDGGGTGSGNPLTYGIFYSVNDGPIVELNAVAGETNPNAGQTDGLKVLSRDDDASLLADPIAVGLTNTGDFSLSGISGLSNDDTVTLYVLARTKKTGSNFSLIADNLKVDGIVSAPIPEPSSTALAGLAGFAFLLRRRK